MSVELNVEEICSLYLTQMPWSYVFFISSSPLLYSYKRTHSIYDDNTHKQAGILLLSVYVDSIFLISHTMVAIQLHVLYTQCYRTGNINID